MDLDGKIKEPLLRVTHLWRAYNATSNDGGYPYGFAYILFGQGPLQSPSVFNFFSPFYAPTGEIRNSGLVENLGTSVGVAELLKLDDWNEMTIIAKGNNYTTWLNGQHVMTYNSESAGERGPVGIQLHGNREMEIWYQDIRMAGL